MQNRPSSVLDSQTNGVQWPQSQIMGHTNPNGFYGFSTNCAPAIIGFNSDLVVKSSQLYTLNFKNKSIGLQRNTTKTNQPPNTQNHETEFKDKC